jgi:hypothetical protein
MLTPDSVMENFPTWPAYKKKWPAAEDLSVASQRVSTLSLDLYL